MSTATTTVIPRTLALHETLRDYALHHSTQGADVAAPAQGDSTRGLTPAGWDVVHRRVPPRRPINRILDQSQRRVYNSAIERTFLTVMFTGVYINATVAQLWRRTGGVLNDTIFRYPLGGEV